MKIFARMHEQYSLALTYAENAALHSAARVLTELAAEAEAAAQLADNALMALLRQYEEDDCPGHVASADDPKVCARCGTHVDSLRPDNEWDLRGKGKLEAQHRDGFNPHGSDPVPIEEREG